MSTIYDSLLTAFWSIAVPQTDDRQTAAQNFSKEIKQSCENSKDKPEYPHLLYIQKRWALVCHEIAFSSAQELSNVTSKRIPKIFQALAKIISGILYPPQVPNAPVKRPAAFEVVDIVSTEEFRSFLPKCLDPAVFQVKAMYPNAIRQTEMMCRRIAAGTYGPRLQWQVADPKKNPLATPAHFKKMLLVDMLLHNVDPIKNCEWFQNCPQKDVETVKACLVDLKQALQAKCHLCEEEINGSLMSKSPYLPPKVEEKFARVAKFMLEGDQTFAMAYELVRHLFQPNYKMLLACGLVAGHSHNYERALYLFQRAHEQIDADSKKVQYVMKSYCKLLRRMKLNLEHFITALKPYKNRDTHFYRSGIIGVTKALLKQPDDASLCHVLPLLHEMEPDEDYALLVSNYLIELGTQKVTEDTLATCSSLINRMTIIDHQISAVITFLMSQWHLSPKNANTVPWALDGCTVFLERFQNHAIYPYVQGVFVSTLLTSEKGLALDNPQAVSRALVIFKKMADAERRDLLEVLSVHAFKNSNQEHAKAHLFALAQKLPNQKDKDVLYKHIAANIPNKDQKTLEALCRLIQDDETRIQAKRFMPCDDSNRPLAALTALMNTLQVDDSKLTSTLTTLSETNDPSLPTLVSSIIFNMASLPSTPEQIAHIHTILKSLKTLDTQLLALQSFFTAKFASNPPILAKQTSLSLLESLKNTPLFPHAQCALVITMTTSEKALTLSHGALGIFKTIQSPSLCQDLIEFFVHHAFKSQPLPEATLQMTRLHHKLTDKSHLDTLRKHWSLHLAQKGSFPEAQLLSSSIQSTPTRIQTNRLLSNYHPNKPHPKTVEVIAHLLNALNLP